MGVPIPGPIGTNWAAAQAAGVEMVQTFQRISHTNPAVHCIAGDSSHAR